jgi:hypothetical protein
MGTKEGGTSGTNFSNSPLFTWRYAETTCSFVTSSCGYPCSSKNSDMIHSTTSTKIRSNINLALQRCDEEQETKKGNTEREREREIVMREVHVCIPLQKEEEREERERER